MNQFSLLVRLQKPNPVLLQRMLDSVLAQSNNAWELVLVVGAQSPNDQATAVALAADWPNVRVELRPEGELLAWACNALLPTLGDWVGFVGQHDQLMPSALSAMAGTLGDQPQARIIYCDQESLGTWGQVSMQNDKGLLDPLRLLSEEYLQDLALIQRSWLATMGGFARLASDQPRHDLYLRTLESLGTVAFAHTAQRLYRHHRNRLIEITTDRRRKPYLPPYDLDAVRRHFERMNIPVKIKQLDGTLDIDFEMTKAPSVTVLLLLGDDLQQGKASLAGIGILPLYQPWDVRVLFQGTSDDTFSQYAHLCKGLRYPLQRITGNLPEELNQAVSDADTDLTLFLKGMPLNAHWLKRLVAITQLPGISAASGNLITPTRQLGRDVPWDSRGAFNHLAVPHIVSVLPPACLLTDTRAFLQLGGFDPDYPTLYAMDFSLRLTAAGHNCAITPRVQIQVEPAATPEPGELDLLREKWDGWEDPYGLHQL